MNIRENISLEPKARAIESFYKKWEVPFYLSVTIHAILLISLQEVFDDDFTNDSRGAEQFQNSPEYYLEFFLYREILEGVISVSEAEKVQKVFYENLEELKKNDDGDNFRLLYEVAKLKGNYHPLSRNVSTTIISPGLGNCESRALNSFLYLKALDSDFKRFNKMYFQFFQNHVRLVVEISGKFYHLENPKGPTLIQKSEGTVLLEAEKLVSSKTQQIEEEGQNLKFVASKVDPSVSKIKSVSSVFDNVQIPVSEKELPKYGEENQVLKETPYVSEEYAGIIKEKGIFTVNYFPELLLIAKNGTLSDRIALAKDTSISSELMNILSMDKDVEVLWELVQNPNLSEEASFNVLMSKFVNNDKDVVYQVKNKSGDNLEIFSPKDFVAKIIQKNLRMVLRYRKEFASHKVAMARAVVSLFDNLDKRIFPYDLLSNDERELLKNDPDMRVRKYINGENIINSETVSAEGLRNIYKNNLDSLINSFL